MDIWPYLYNEEFFQWRKDIFLFSDLFWAVTLVVGLVLRRWRFPVHRRMLLFVGYSLLMEYVTSDMDWKLLFSTRGNSPLYHLFTPGLFWILTLQFTTTLFTGRLKPLRWVLPTAFLVLSVLNALLINGFYQFPSLTASLYAFTGITLCIGYLLHLLHTLTVERLELDPFFWFASGGLIYYSGTLLFLASVEYINYEKQFFASLFSVLRLLTILFNLALITALIIQPSKEKVPTGSTP